MFEELAKNTNKILLEELEIIIEKIEKGEEINQIEKSILNQYYILMKNIKERNKKKGIK